VLLTGAGNNAHVYDTFGPLLAQHYRVYAITRRGFAPSTITAEGFRADSLANDVLAVLDSLGLGRPVLVGHSIAGQELSSIGGRMPERVAGLAYLDAGYPYALYDPSLSNPTYVMPDAIRNLTLAFDRWAPLTFAERAKVLRELADSTLPVLQRDMREWADRLERNPNANAPPIVAPRDPVASALFLGAQRHRSVAAPVLALYAAPRQLAPAVAADPVASAKADSSSLADLGPQIDAFQRAVPHARVIRIRHAHHYLFRSHPDEVLRELRTFIDALPVDQ
jgi:pimeloyl-ACP methyl ester carboxylesterase